IRHPALADGRPLPRQIHGVRYRCDRSRSTDGEATTARSRIFVGDRNHADGLGQLPSLVSHLAASATGITACARAATLDGSRAAGLLGGYLLGDAGRMARLERFPLV